MKKLIRSKKTGLFLASTKRHWTNSIAHAWHFDSPITAFQLLDHSNFQEDVELYFAFAHRPTKYDFTLPITPTPASRQRDSKKFPASR